MTYCFTEITHRFHTATPAIRQVLLQYLLPWLHNMELVDPNINMEATNNQDFPEIPPKNYSDYMKPPLKGEGWGSPQATEMVLNNLLFITSKVDDNHLCLLFTNIELNLDRISGALIYVVVRLTVWRRSLQGDRGSVGCFGRLLARKS